MSELVRSEVEAALERWAESGGSPTLVSITDLDTLAAAARAWLSSPTEPTDEQGCDGTTECLAIEHIHGCYRSGRVLEEKP